MQIRIGIDVGGTFTDAVAIDASTLELIGQVKVPTTHHAAEGVAVGIIDALHRLLADLGLDASAVRFIAHGTTQATNALLEGDVSSVGVVGIGGGVEGLRARSQTAIDPIELAPGKSLVPTHCFIPTNTPSPEQANAAVAELRTGGARVVVASGMYSVDDPTAEAVVMDAATRATLPSTGAHEITKLYGLKTRTRTAVINASILPRMVETADSVERSVVEAGIGAPLMIMRGDGGVMSIEQLRRRPILTLVSGPAAGVAGALMYERVSDGIFLEVGGTSVDISAIRDGRVQVNYATIGGHQTYLQSLDVRSLGVGGGSMVRLSTSGFSTSGFSTSGFSTSGFSTSGFSKGKVDVGPRSAHIAGLDYAVYSRPDDVRGAKLVQFAPLPGDPEDYVAVESHGRRFALTLSCAANVAGFVAEGDWARGNAEAARIAFEPLAQTLGTTVETAARAVLDAAIARTRPTVEALAHDYGLDSGRFVLVGGGGGAATLVPALAKALGREFSICRNAQVISPIGVGLALVRDVVERMIVNPSADDVRAVRAEAEDAAVAAGARRETIEVDVVVDTSRNVVRAVAVGATELRARDLTHTDAGDDERRKAAADSLAASPEALELAAATPQFFVYRATVKPGGFLGRFAKAKQAVRVVDREGVVRLRVADGSVVATTSAQTAGRLRSVLDELTSYDDAGKMLPTVHVLVRDKIVNLSGLPNPDLVVSLASDEMRAADPAEPTIIVAELRG